MAPSSQKPPANEPAARFLAALDEVETAERETRRICRHLIEFRLPGGKNARHLRLQEQAVTLATIDRLIVQHAANLEMNVDSYRRRAALDRTAALADNAATAAGDNFADNIQEKHTP